jgi:large subunit ribosomal protein L23e
MSKKVKKGGKVGVKQRVTLGLPVGAVMNCSDNSGAKTVYTIAVTGLKGKLSKLPSGSVGDMIIVCVKKGIQKLKKKVMQAIIIRQRKAWRRKEGIFIHCEDNAAVIANLKGELKGSAINGPVAKECSELWPKVSSKASSIF